MDLKAIVLDVDGTLLTNEKKISSKTKASLIAAQQRGIKVILASGRPTNAMVKFANELQLADYGGYLVSYNGAVVTNFETNEIVFSEAIPAEIAKEILNHLEKFDVIPMINDDQFMFVNDVYNNLITGEDGKINIIDYESRGGDFLLCEAPRLSEVAEFPLYKILVAGEPSYLQAAVDQIYAPFTTEVTAAFSAPFYYEFTAKHIDKAKALDFVLPSLGIEAENILAFGDGHNDYTMLDYAGLSVAMGNGVAEIKALADEVTLTNDQDGISAVVARYL